MAVNPVPNSREEMVLEDLYRHFPGFLHVADPWKFLSRGEDPPDALGVSTTNKRIGLELTEWLHGDQMTAAKGRDAMRKDLAAIFEWQNHAIPKNFQTAIVWPHWGRRVKRADATSLCLEFHAATGWMDANWELESQSLPVVLGQEELKPYSVLRKYVTMVQFHAGRATDLTQHGISWIDFEWDGGAYDPGEAVQALIDAITDKAEYYETAERAAHLARKKLDELVLLVHGGFNQYAYNTPFSAPGKNLKTIAREVADCWAANKTPFSQIWLFHSLGSNHCLAELAPAFQLLERK